MKTGIKKTLEVFRTVLLFMMAALTGVNVITIVLQVIFRYFFKVSLSWANELAGISLVWITFLGATLATIDETNIGFDMVIKKLAPLPKLIMKTICNLLILGVVIIIAYYGVSTVKYGLNSKLITIPLTLGAAVSVVPAAAAVMVIGVLINIFKDIDAFRHAASNSEDEDHHTLYDDVPEEIITRSQKAYELHEAETKDEAANLKDKEENGE